MSYPSLFYFSLLPTISYYYLLENARRNMFLHSLLILPHNRIHLCPHFNHHVYWRQVKGGISFTVLLNLVPPPISIISQPPPPLLLGCPSRRLFLGVLSTLIPHTAPQNITHYCNFFIFVVFDIFLHLYTY